MTTHTLTFRLIHIAPSKKPNTQWDRSGSESDSHVAFADELYEFYTVHHDAFATTTVTFGGKRDAEYYLGKVTVGRESTGRAACNMTIAFFSLPAHIPPGTALLAVKATDILARTAGRHTIEIQVDNSAESAKHHQTTSIPSGAIILAPQEDELDQRLNRVLSQYTRKQFPQFISPLRECVSRFDLQGLLLDTAQTNVVRLPAPAIIKPTVRTADRSSTSSPRIFWLSILVTVVVTAPIAAAVTWGFWSYRVDEEIFSRPVDIKNKLSEIRMENETLEQSNKDGKTKFTALTKELRSKSQTIEDLNKKSSELKQSLKLAERKYILAKRKYIIRDGEYNDLLKKINTGDEEGVTNTLKKNYSSLKTNHTEVLKLIKQLK